jgi:hypothetical protein
LANPFMSFFNFFKNAENGLLQTPLT